MKHLYGWLVVVALFMGAVPAHPQMCEEGQIWVFFGNGVETSRMSALGSAVELRNAIRPGLSDTDRDRVRFAISYNTDNLLMGDFIDSFGQWDDEMGIRFIRWLRGLGSPSPQFQSALETFIRAIDTRRFVVDSDLRAHVERYRELLEQGHKVIVVSHSQGNFYANSAHRLVGSTSFGITAVATPAGVVEGGGPYTTLVGDFITAVPGSLPGNVTNQTRGDWFNHGFVTSYLSGTASRARIVTSLHQMIASLPYPEREVEAGIITVRLTWGAQPDVDLHVFEPDGRQVYYASPSGNHGYLDVDDVDGFGPEHYYVSCDDLEAGTFRVAVNYYHGDSPETARVQVSAGDITRNYSRTLPTARGSSGNASPVPVASIVVTRDSLGRFAFDVTEDAASVLAESRDADVSVPKPPFTSDRRARGISGETTSRGDLLRPRT